MMIKWMIRCERRAEPGSGLAVAGTLLRRPLPANTPQCLQDEALVDLIRIKMGWAREVFEPVVRPVIEGYAAFVYGLPATESRPQADSGAPSGARFTHALQVGSRALDFRRGQILPRGAAPEVIGAQAHRWTYAVFVAALLHDAMEDCGVTKMDLIERFGAPVAELVDAAVQIGRASKEAIAALAHRAVQVAMTAVLDEAVDETATRH
jgi:hypothetical protein